MKKIENEVIKKAVKDSTCIADVCRILGYKDSGGIYKKIKDFILHNKIDISHFKRESRKPKKYPYIRKQCPVCEKEFTTQKGLKHETIYCSKSCSNIQRKHSEETKNKISNSNRKVAEQKTGKDFSIQKKNCECCGKEFEYRLNKTKNRKYCSNVCSGKSGKNNLPKLSSERWSEIQKKAYADSRRSVAGGNIKWFPYKDIKVQGTYELRTCFILDKMLENNMIYKWEYTNDRFEYLNVKGIKSTYLLDFKIYLTETEFYYLETKGYERENDRLKWNAVRNQGHTLIVWMLKEIEENELIYNTKLDYENTKYPNFNRKIKQIERKKVKDERINGLTKKEIDSKIARRKYIRPPYDELIKEVNQNGYKPTGRKYGVTSNLIKDWIKFYEKYENPQSSI